MRIPDVFAGEELFFGGFSGEGRARLMVRGERAAAPSRSQRMTFPEDSEANAYIPRLRAARKSDTSSARSGPRGRARARCRRSARSRCGKGLPSATRASLVEEPRSRGERPVSARRQALGPHGHTLGQAALRLPRRVVPGRCRPRRARAERRAARNEADLQRADDEILGKRRGSPRYLAPSGGGSSPCATGMDRRRAHYGPESDPREGIQRGLLRDARSPTGLEPVLREPRRGRRRGHPGGGGHRRPGHRGDLHL